MYAHQTPFCGVDNPEPPEEAPGQSLRGEVFDLRGALAVASPPAATVPWPTDQDEAGGRSPRPFKI